MAAPEPSPGLARPSQMHFPSTSPIDEGPFPMLSEAEEAEMDRARASGFRGDHDGGSDDGHGHAGHYHVEEEEERGDHPVDSVGGSSGYDSHARLLRRRGSDEESGPPRPRGDARHAGPHQVPNNFDFTAMEEYATKERGMSPGDRPVAWIPNGNGAPRGPAGPDLARSYDTAMERTNTNTMSAFGEDHDAAFSPKESELGTSHQQGFHRRRQRKLSQSNPVLRRQGKLAVFEGFGSQGAAAEGESSDAGAPFKAARQPKNLGPASNGFAAYSDAAPGHDRPYRFSFYSNALPVTIHARTLAELPAEGQTFEDLFKGRNEGEQESGRPNNAEGTDYGSIRTTPRGSEAVTPNVPEGGALGGKLSMLARAAGAAPKGNGHGGGAPNGTAEEDPEAFTWWLDVLSPTDEEMRMLSKVSSSLCVSLTVGLRDPSPDNGRYPARGDAREDRALPELLSRLFPVVRPRPVQSDLPRTAQHVHHRLPRGHPERELLCIRWSR